MWQHDSIQSIEFNSSILMWTEHHFNSEKSFSTRENNMDRAEDILAIYVNLINMIDAFTNLQMDFIFSIGNHCKKFI